VEAKSLAFMHDREVVSVKVCDADGSVVFERAKSNEKGARSLTVPIGENGAAKGNCTVSYTSYPFDAVAFEKSVNDFRYSLFPLVDNLSRETLRQFDLKPENAPKLNETVVAYLSAHREEIIRYRNAVLWNNAGHADLSGYEKLPFSADENSFAGEKIDQFFSSRPVIEFVAMNPYVFVNFFITIWYSNKFGVQEMAERSIRLQVGVPRIFTMVDPGGKWTIWCDDFRNVVVFDYDPVTGIPLMREVWQRKKGD
ncbi:MAG TPA: hypothetical protein VF857_08090, partial [Spirochaetota bacterium]